ncbi:hypothetical protein Mpop_3479 [Methylorubrum populi BJ001]|jgi:hypothetical protein|uniref:Uncharacterized protein n=1 Tax=Methylorubrum populi (strain ATCC BAA-705 / NCIMB 13946 / BJ001) TaxID=441620 RepID=B1ZKQ9_METPB|nr:hypothetical protein Mpop_3479 [Methylorubrum populi BJ001]
MVTAVGFGDGKGKGKGNGFGGVERVCCDLFAAT